MCEIVGGGASTRRCPCILPVFRADENTIPGKVERTACGIDAADGVGKGEEEGIKINEMGTLQGEHRFADWIAKAFTICQSYRSVIYKKESVRKVEIFLYRNFVQIWLLY